jgi:hypothetical protein
MKAKPWFKRAPLEPDAIRPPDGDAFAAKMFRKELLGKYVECECGWFFKEKCPKCPTVSRPHLDVMA